MEVRLADRPGALGAVASRIGAVGGDVAGVEIVERGGGIAVDEFVIELPERCSVELLVSEIEEVDGASVAHVRRMDRGGPQRDGAYEAALSLARQRSPEDLLAALVAAAGLELQAPWAAVVDAGAGFGGVLFGHGRPPAPTWLTPYAAGLRVSPEDETAPEMAGAVLPNFDVVLVAGRPGWPFRASERDRLRALAVLADTRWSDLARATHPSRAG